MYACLGQNVLIGKGGRGKGKEGREKKLSLIMSHQSHVRALGLFGTFQFWYSSFLCLFGTVHFCAFLI